MIPGFDRGVEGMSPGDERRVTIPAEDAYGEPREELVLRVPRAEFPVEIIPDLGVQLQLSDGNQSFVATVVEVDDDAVVLDANHPLAGQDLTFELRLVEIR